MSNIDFTKFNDARDELNFAALNIAMLAELFGHDVEKGGYPTLVGEKSRLGMFFALKKAAESIHQAIDTISESIKTQVVIGSDGEGRD